MTITIKRRSFCCTKETEEKLEYLTKKWGETNSYVIKIAISHLYEKNINTKSYKLDDKIVSGKETIIFD